MSAASKFSLLPAILLSVTTAGATQPLSDFLEGAHTHAFDAQEAEALSRQRNWEAEAARGRLLPAFTARGTITHNQFKAELPPGTFPGQTEPISIQKQNQLDATFTLDVPLVDLANYHRFRSARHLAKASELTRDATSQRVDQAVAQAYFTYLGAEALLEAAEKSSKSAEENLAFVTTRTELGAATTLDRERAVANVQRAKQDIADARLLSVTAARNLETLSGISPTEPQEYPVDNLAPEAPLSDWMKERDTPQDRVQAELDKAARASKKAASYALLPTLSASAQERVSNAAGFTGKNASYVLSAALTWRLDWSTYGAAQAQAAAAEVQSISTQRTRRNLEDSIFQAYHRVEAEIAKNEAARAQAEAAERAADLSKERYQAGAVTQLDVIQSQRDAFSAQATLIKADADLALARILLRISAGKDAALPPTLYTTKSLEAEEGALTAPAPKPIEPSLPDDSQEAAPTTEPTADPSITP